MAHAQQGQPHSSLFKQIVKVFRKGVFVLNSSRLNVFSTKEFAGEKSNRSDSDNGLYVAFVQKAVRDYHAFKNFKRHPSYQAILEHVSKEAGGKYLDIVKIQSPAFLNQIEKCKDNDLIGNPIKHFYYGIGNISPTTLRYIKVASDLQKHFGTNIGKKIAEIGVGYGGQLLINDRLLDIAQYHLYDLPPVLNLASKYLESYILSSSYKVTTLNQSSGEDFYDLVISNYAFSELPSQLQLKYIEKILSKSRKGYLTMNSGLENSGSTNNKLSVSELRKFLPAFEIFDESPRTSPNNYIIVWGHNVSTR
jgi:putative sugar O-methyltransferase